jgi:hypothetical protein
MLILLSALALAQSTCQLTVTATLVDAAQIDSARLPASVEGIPVSVWTFDYLGYPAGNQVRPCTSCPWLPQTIAEDPAHDWSGYPMRDDGPPPAYEAPRFELKLPEKPPVQTPPPPPDVASTETTS